MSTQHYRLVFPTSSMVAAKAFFVKGELVRGARWRRLYLDRR
jgi:hypothetical protein